MLTTRSQPRPLTCAAGAGRFRGVKSSLPAASKTAREEGAVGESLESSTQPNVPRLNTGYDPDIVVQETAMAYTETQ